MSLHLKDFNQTNQMLENKIDKTIDQIESKMKDVLNVPHNIEAIDFMEKEIANALTLMKKIEPNAVSTSPRRSPKVSSENTHFQTVVHYSKFNYRVCQKYLFRNA